MRTASRSRRRAVGARRPRIDTGSRRRPGGPLQKRPAGDGDLADVIDPAGYRREGQAADPRVEGGRHRHRAGPAACRWRPVRRPHRTSCRADRRTQSATWRCSDRSGRRPAAYPPSPTGAHISAPLPATQSLPNAVTPAAPPDTPSPTCEASPYCVQRLNARHREPGIYPTFEVCESDKRSSLLVPPSPDPSHGGRVPAPPTHGSEFGSLRGPQPQRGTPPDPADVPPTRRPPKSHIPARNRIWGHP